MQNDTDYLDDLTVIRTLMQRSSRFISLSGLSGVFAGLFALAGAAVAYQRLSAGEPDDPYADGLRRIEAMDWDLVVFLLVDAAMVLSASVAAAVYFTTRKSRKAGVKPWDAVSKRLVINLAVPVAAGGIFCAALLYHGAVAFVVPAMLLFYGMGLLNGSKYTLDDIRYLGLCEIGLGLAASFMVGYGFAFWCIGFGVLHVLYGAMMYFKYDRG